MKRKDVLKENRVKEKRFFFLRKSNVHVLFKDYMIFHHDNNERCGKALNSRPKTRHGACERKGKELTKRYI